MATKINKIVFVNPSQNMEQVIDAVAKNGKEVIKVFTKDRNKFYASSLWACINGEFIDILEREDLTGMELANSLKKPFFSSLKKEDYAQKLEKIHSGIKSATFQDYMLFTNSCQKYNINSSMEQFDDFDAVIKAYSDAIIVTSELPGGKLYYTRWRTDYDLEEVIGDDCFFFYDDKGRHEVYKEGNNLVTVSECKPETGWLKSLNPSFIRFAFEKIISKQIARNRKQWVIKDSSKVYLVNDYSFYGISVRMNESWLKALSKFLCSD